MFGFILGVAVASAAYYGANWLHKMAKKLDDQNEIVRILDLLQADDDLYPFFNMKYLPVLKNLEQVYYPLENVKELEFLWRLLLRCLLLDSYEILWINNNIKNLLDKWSPKKIVAVAAQLSKLQINQLNADNASRALQNADKYSEFLGDQSLVMSPYLSDAEFAQTIDLVLYEHEDLDEYSDTHLVNIINTINREVFTNTIKMAGAISRDPEHLATCIFYGELLDQLLTIGLNKFITCCYQEPNTTQDSQDDEDQDSQDDEDDEDDDDDQDTQDDDQDDDQNDNQNENQCTKKRKNDLSELPAKKCCIEQGSKCCGESDKCCDDCCSSCLDDKGHCHAKTAINYNVIVKTLRLLRDSGCPVTHHGLDEFLNDSEDELTNKQNETQETTQEIQTTQDTQETTQDKHQKPFTETRELTQDKHQEPFTETRELTQENQTKSEPFTNTLSNQLDQIDK